MRGSPIHPNVHNLITKSRSKEFLPGVPGSHPVKVPSSPTRAWCVRWSPYESTSPRPTTGNCYLSQFWGGDNLLDHLPLTPHLGSWRPQTPINQHVDLAFGVFNNKDKVEEAKIIQGQQQKAQLLVASLNLAPPQGYIPLWRSMVRTGSRKPESEPLSCQESISFKCDQEGHWKVKCSLYGKSPWGPAQYTNERAIGSGTAPRPKGDSGLPNQWWLRGLDIDGAWDPPWLPKDTWSFLWTNLG